MSESRSRALRLYAQLVHCPKRQALRLVHTLPGVPRHHVLLAHPVCGHRGGCDSCENRAANLVKSKDVGPEARQLLGAVAALNGHYGLVSPWQLGRHRSCCQTLRGMRHHDE